MHAYVNQNQHTLPRTGSQGSCWKDIPVLNRKAEVPGMPKSSGSQSVSHKPSGVEGPSHRACLDHQKTDVFTLQLVTLAQLQL